MSKELEARRIQAEHQRQKAARAWKREDARLAGQVSWMNVGGPVDLSTPFGELARDLGPKFPEVQLPRVELPLPNLSRPIRVGLAWAMTLTALAGCTPTPPGTTEPTRPAATATAKPWPTEARPTVAPTKAATKEVVKPTPTLSNLSTGEIRLASFNPNGQLEETVGNGQISPELVANIQNDYATFVKALPENTATDKLIKTALYTADGAVFELPMKEGKKGALVVVSPVGTGQNILFTYIREVGQGSFVALASGGVNTEKQPLATSELSPSLVRIGEGGLGFKFGKFVFPIEAQDANAQEFIKIVSQEGLIYKATYEVGSLMPAIAGVDRQGHLRVIFIPSTGEMIKFEVPATPTPTKEPTKEPTPVPKAQVEVVDNFEGAKIWVADQARLKQAKDLVFQEMFGKTSGIVNALLPVHNIDQPGGHNVQAKLVLAKGIKAVFRDIESMTPEEQIKYKEGIPLYSKTVARYSESDGQLVVEIFSPKPPEQFIGAGFSANFIYSLIKFIDIKNSITIDNTNRRYLELFIIAVGQPPTTMGGKTELFNPFIGGSLGE